MGPRSSGIALLSTAMFPLVGLRLATIVVLGPVLGSIDAIVSAALCALVGHAIGARLGLMPGLAAIVAFVASAGV